MATTELNHHSSSSVLEKALALAEFGATRVAALWNAVKNRRAVARLLEWDDHMLRDIGLTQGDVRAALSGRLVEDPSGRLDSFHDERRTATRATARERRLEI